MKNIISAWINSYILYFLCFMLLCYFWNIHSLSQSPLPSGDEGDADGTATGIAETLIKPDGGAATEMPSAITAES